MTIHKINSSDFENDYSLIAVHSNAEAYKLAFEINLKLKTNLEKSPFNITFKGNNSVFELFKHVSETYNTKLYLISNKSFVETKTSTTSLFENFSVSRHLIPELKKAEFLIKIEGGGFKIDSLLKKLNEINSIVSCYLTKVNSDKSKYNLIFD
jgi:hypothetical protein|tara:strand:+ start:604 stop:1062 length:459 start_codon:yes stop_codon:yes gene_type:complete